MGRIPQEGGIPPDNPKEKRDKVVWKKNQLNHKRSGKWGRGGALKDREC